MVEIKNIEKNNTYLKCPSGGPLVQHALNAMLELVKQQRFNALNSLVIDNADTARVKYPEGFNSCFLSLEDFEDRYSNQEERKKTYTVKLPISKIYYKQGQVRMVRPEYCIENFQYILKTSSIARYCIENFQYIY